MSSYSTNGTAVHSKSATTGIVTATKAAASATKAASTQNAQKAFRSWQIENYPLQLWWSVAALVGVAMLLYGASLVRRSFRLRRGRHASVSACQGREGEATTQGNNGAASWRNLPGGIASLWKVVLYRWSMPISLNRDIRMTVIEVFFCSAYMLACMTWGYVLSNGPSDFANRNAWIALGQTPLVVGLAGKNNVISFLTGVGPEKLNILHRSAGRTLLILSCTHAFGRYLIGLNGAHAIYQPIMIWGTVSLTSFALTTLLGFRWIRQKFYEVFLWSHIILVFFFLLGAYYHKPSDNYWILPSLSLWALDRLARTLRVILTNRAFFLPSAHAHAQALSDCTLRITLRRPMGWKAGQHAFLCLPGVSRMPWEMHPFTIACAPEGATSGLGMLSNRVQELEFIVRARDGFTKRLMARAQALGGECKVTALVDGAYGCPPSLDEYSTVLLIAGGSGVSYTISLLGDVLRKARAGKAVAKRVEFVWVVRHSQHLEWIARDLSALIRSAPEGVDLRISLWVTHTESLLDLNQLEKEKITSNREGEKSPARSNSFTSVKTLSDVAGEQGAGEIAGLVRLLGVEVHSGRPDVREIIKHAVLESEGPVSVGVCGPAGLSNAVRAALTEKGIVGFGKVLKGRPSVDLHVETFGW